MKTKRIYLCEDDIESIFTSIYDAWNSRYGHENIRIEVLCGKSGYNIELFSEYINVEAEEEKARKVARSIREKISEEAYEMVCKAGCSESREKGDIIYRFLILGFSMGSRVTDCFGNEVVMNLFTLNRNVGNEAHHILGFLRFTELRNGILFARLNPKNDILQLIAPHFSDRFGSENFLIYDEGRNTAVLHQKGYPWVFTDARDLNLDKLQELSEEEEGFQILWKTFFETIAIEERKNTGLQRNNLPLRFRGNMLEFRKNP